MIRFLLLLLLATTTGCGLELAGLAVDSSDAADAAATPDAIPADGGAGGDGLLPLDAPSLGDVAARPPLLDGGGIEAGGGDGGAGCTGTLPTGWTLAVYDSAHAGCPPGFSGHDVSGRPVVGAGACSCTCSVTQPGSCTQGTLDAYATQGGGAMCATAWFSVAVNGTACTSVPSSASGTVVPTQFQAALLAPQGGACAGTLKMDTTQVAAPSAHYCDVPAASADAVCNGNAPPGFAACIATSGVTTCPAGTPFVNSYVVEDTAMLQCSACSDCRVNTTCSGATLTTYSDSACLNLGATLTVDGSCSPTGVTGPSHSRPTVDAVTYSANGSSTCAAGSAAPSVTLGNPRTICCH